MEEAQYFYDEYVRVVNAIIENKLDASLSIKPTAFGLLIDADKGFTNIKNLVEMASKYDIFVRLDMEDHRVTEETIQIHNNNTEKKDSLDLFYSFLEYYELEEGDTFISTLKKTNLNDKQIDQLILAAEDSMKTNQLRIGTRIEIISELIKDSDNGKSFAIVSIMLLIGFSFHGYTFIVSIDDEIRAKYAESEFNIQFFEEILEDDDSIIVGDGNTETITLSRQNIGVSSEKMIAKLEFTITYSETSGEFGDPCDEVRVEIPPNGMIADWQNENNMLANSTDDCETMSLLVYILSLKHI